MVVKFVGAVKGNGWILLIRNMIECFGFTTYGFNQIDWINWNGWYVE